MDVMDAATPGENENDYFDGDTTEPEDFTESDEGYNDLEWKKNSTTGL